MSNMESSNARKHYNQSDAKGQKSNFEQNQSGKYLKNAILCKLGNELKQLGLNNA